MTCFLCLWMLLCLCVQPTRSREENQQRHGWVLGSGNFLPESVRAGEICYVQLGSSRPPPADPSLPAAPSPLPCCSSF